MDSKYNNKPTSSEDMKEIIEVLNVDSFKDVSQLFYQTGVFDNLVHDDCTEDDIMTCLSSHNALFQVSYGGEFGGMFKVEDLGTICGFNTCEIHAFIIPYMRRYSIRFLKAFAQFIFEVSSFDTIVTTVPDNTKYVIKVLKMIGFKEINWSLTGFKKDGKELGMTSLYLKKSIKEE